MPRYNFIRLESGNTVMQLADAQTAEFEPPEPPPLPEVDAATALTVHRCTVENCGHDFPIVALVAKHFKKEHEHLYENKDSWRQYHTEIIVG